MYIFQRMTSVGCPPARQAYPSLLISQLTSDGPLIDRLSNPTVKNGLGYKLDPQQPHTTRFVSLAGTAALAQSRCLRYVTDCARRIEGTRRVLGSARQQLEAPGRATRNEVER